MQLKTKYEQIYHIFSRLKPSHCYFLQCIKRFLIAKGTGITLHKLYGLIFKILFTLNVFHIYHSTNIFKIILKGHLNVFSRLISTTICTFRSNIFCNIPSFDCFVAVLIVLCFESCHVRCS